MIRLKINLAEASTRRGIVLFIAGGAALYHLLFGAGALPPLDVLLAQADVWLAVGLQIAGLLGIVLPDQKPPPP